MQKNESENKRNKSKRKKPVVALNASNPAGHNPPQILPAITRLKTRC